MKKYFAKQVTERPRSGSSNPSAKARWYGKIICGEDGLDYDGFTRLPASRKQYGYHPKIGDKSFTDVLGPIEGYLHSCIGRKWDDVYSELSANLGQGSWPIRHVLTAHVDVATKTYRGVDGAVYNCGSRRYSTNYRCDTTTSRYLEYYVDPNDRTLRAAKRVPTVWEIKRQKDKLEPPSRIQVGEIWYVKINAVWFIGTYREVPFYPVNQDNDWRMPIEVRYPVPDWPNVRLPGWDRGTLVFTKIKQANKKELKALRRRCSSV